MKLLLNLKLIKMKSYVLIFALITMFIAACSPAGKTSDKTHLFYTNADGHGPVIELEFNKGKAHSYPLLAIWIETEDGKYIQTLYVSESIAKGVFQMGDSSSGKWLPGPLRRPSALPYWARKRNVLEDDGLYVPTPKTAIVDAYTGPTPQNSFRIKAKADKPLSMNFKVMLEINQSFDYNDFWNKTRFPGDREYAASAQPSLIYASDIIDPTNPKDSYFMKVIGHGHFNGSDGKLFSDLEGHSTALNIVKSLKIIVRY